MAVVPQLSSVAARMMRTAISERLHAKMLEKGGTSHDAFAVAVCFCLLTVGVGTALFAVSARSSVVERTSSNERCRDDLTGAKAKAWSDRQSKRAASTLPRAIIIISTAISKQQQQGGWVGGSSFMPTRSENTNYSPLTDVKIVRRAPISC